MYRDRSLCSALLFFVLDHTYFANRLESHFVIKRNLCKWLQSMKRDKQKLRAKYVYHKLVMVYSWCKPVAQIMSHYRLINMIEVLLVINKKQPENESASQGTLIWEYYLWNKLINSSGICVTVFGTYLVKKPVSTRCTSVSLARLIQFIVAGGGLKIIHVLMTWFRSQQILAKQMNANKVLSPPTKEWRN